jgi:hypothetical protein
MSEPPKLGAILVADVVGYGRLAGADEERTASIEPMRARRRIQPFILKSAISAVAFGAAFLAAHGAFGFEGRNVAGDRAYRQELTITKRADGRFDVAGVVGTEGCSGLVDARGAADGDMLKAEAEFDGGTCVLTFRRTRTGVRVQTENCESLSWGFL